MLTIDQARQIANGEPEVAELLRSYAEVDAYYREAIAAMNTPESPVAPVLNSAGVTLSFESAGATFEWSSRER